MNPKMDPKMVANFISASRSGSSGHFLPYLMHSYSMMHSPANLRMDPFLISIMYSQVPDVFVHDDAPAHELDNGAVRDGAHQ